MAATNHDPSDGGGGSEEDPSLSGQGRYIAFYSSRSGRGDIYLYDSPLERLLRLPGLNTPDFTQKSPAISGSGCYIAYESNRRGNGTASLVPLPFVRDFTNQPTYPSIR